MLRFLLITSVFLALAVPAMAQDAEVGEEYESRSRPKKTFNTPCPYGHGEELVGRARAVGSRACLVGYSTEVECGEQRRGVLEREVGDAAFIGSIWLHGRRKLVTGYQTFGRAGYCVSTE